MSDQINSEFESAQGDASRAVKVFDVLAELALYVSTALIVTGLILPSVWKWDVLGGTDYNLLGVIQTLFDAGLYILGAVVFLFSGVFPLAKTITAAIIFRRGAPPTPRLARLLNALGKWSMLDVFLAAVLIGLTQAATYIGVEIRAGLYYFAAGVLLNNLATMRLTYTHTANTPERLSARD